MGLIRILLIADTHLGFDLPFRPRIKRRRRGLDFFANSPLSGIAQGPERKKAQRAGILSRLDRAHLFRSKIGFSYHRIQILISV